MQASSQQTGNNMVDIIVTENGSRNHPYYLRIFVDNIIVYNKSYMSKAAAEAATEAALKKALEEYVRVLRKFSNLAIDTDLTSYNTKPVHFSGTGHDDG